MASAKTQSAIARRDIILVHAVLLKLMIKVKISGRMASIGINDVVNASVYSEKTHLNIIMNKLQETTIFHRRQKLTSAKN